MKTFLGTLTIVALLAAPLALGGCKKKEAGPAQKAGEKADDAMKKAGEAAEKSGG